MWDFYDKITSTVPENIYIDHIQVGETWTIVSAGKYLGVAVTVNEQNKPLENYSYLCGKSLKEIAALCKSWDFTKASIGTAALNAYVNSPENLENLGCKAATNTFDDYKEIAAGKKVAIIGHFIRLERFLTDSEVYVLERNPEPGDYPDSACEFLLPEMDFTFITGSAFINKTLPRLLELSKHPVILGPSTPMSPTLFEYGAKELSGFLPSSITKENTAAISHGGIRLADYGIRVSFTA